MADALTEVEEQMVAEFVAIAKELQLHKNGDKKSWNKATAVKFMMARKFDICRAVALFEAHEVMRRREGLIRFDPTSDILRNELETGKFTILPVRDSNGAAIAVFTAHKHVPLETSHQVTLQGVIYQLDVALESIETQRCGIVFIYNMTGSKYANFDYELSQKILNLLKGGYPARLKKVLIVAAPLWFKASFKIFQLFLREKLRDRQAEGAAIQKLFMVTVEQLPLHVPLSSLPYDLGGSLEIDHGSWLQHCLKSTHNRGQEEEEEGRGSSEVLEKHDSEDREKEVEVVKEPQRTILLDSLDTMKEPEEPCLLTPESGGTDLTEEEEEEDDRRLSDCSMSNGVLPSNAPWLQPGGMTLEKFIEYLRAKGRKGLFEEYNEIKGTPPDGTFDSSKLKPNQPKNRYTDVLCYDHSRVRLPATEDDPCSDYINANFVDGYKHKNAFISTQGPLPKTFSDFWSMIWDQETHVIVMTTKTVERGRVKCGQYWPLEENTGMEFGDFDVYNTGVECFTDYIVSNLILTNKKQNTSQEVCHMQFISWPDFGVPHSAVAMLDFRDKVLSRQALAVQNIGPHWTGHPKGPPIVVHCSAGIGRTGTFITLDICIHRLEDTGLIDIIETVRSIRGQRAYSIQMPDQYVFCHLALLEYALSRGLLQDVDLSGFNDQDSDSE